MNVGRSKRDNCPQKIVIPAYGQKGDVEMTEEKIEILKGKDLFEFADMVDRCARKIAFIGDFFSQKEKMGERPWFSNEGYTGFYFILRDLQDEVESIVDQMYGKKERSNH